MSTVYVGLSGGVDSAVSAALLKEAGHSVIGAFIKIWQPEFIECTWKEDRLDAMRVCAALHIPFKEVDLSREYEKDVIRTMVEGYKTGVTPNPDVLCNSRIKFGAFAKWAKSEGAERVATGHYARIEKYGHGVSIFRGKDANKDQSYFLWQLTETDLQTSLFPVGGMKKSDVRAAAERFGLPVAKKPDSQGLCFVGDVSMSDFLKRYIPLAKGAIMDESGRRIGTHDGAALFTLGQRHGFSIDGHGTEALPHYVVGIDTDSNEITVSSHRSHAARDFVFLKDVNLLEGTPPFKTMAQVRYRERAFSAEVTKISTRYAIQFEEPVIAAKGQSVVFYEGDRLVGGGVIE